MSRLLKADGEACIEQSQPRGEPGREASYAAQEIGSEEEDDRDALDHDADDEEPRVSHASRDPAVPGRSVTDPYEQGRTSTCGKLRESGCLAETDSGG